jgi:ribonuclease D
VSTIPLELVERDAALHDLLARFEREAVVGIDTEAASFHRYKDRVYLLQLSSRTATAIVDPLGTGGLGPIGPWLGTGRTEFVFHDADYDLRLLRLEYGFEVGRLFDTRIAAQFLNEPSVGLGALLESRFGVKTDKRFQRADWSLRPLEADMLEYAATDTHYLIPLRDQFHDELVRIGRFAWVQEEFELLTKVEWGEPESPDEGFLRMKGARRLDRRGLAVLRELHRWREDTASRLDRAQFRILGNDSILHLATSRPTTIPALEQVPGMGRETIARRGAELLEAIGRGLRVPDAELPAFPRPPRVRPDPAFDVRLEQLKAWRLGLAERIGLPVGLVAPNALLEGVARRTPHSLEELATVPGIRRWQVGEFGGELLGVIARAP